MRTLHLSVALCASLVSAACFNSSTTIRIKGDGSGTIEQTTLLTAAAMAQMRQLAAMSGENGKPLDLFSADQAQQMASALGPDVKLVSSKPVKNADGEGNVMMFSFTDVTKLHLNQQPSLPGGVAVDAPGVQKKAEEVKFAFSRNPDGNAVLGITMPSPKMPAVPMPTAPAGSSGAANRVSPEQIAMAKQMLAGMRLAIAVEPEGTLVKTNSPFVDGRKVTLIDL